MSNRHCNVVTRSVHRLCVAGVVASLLCMASLPARAQETIRMTIAAGHPSIFLWVRLFSDSFIPTVDAELAKTGKYKIAWTEAYGGTLAKIGSELETMQQGISDVGAVGTIFHSSKMPLNNVSFFVPFGPSDTDVVTKAISGAQETREMKAEWAKYNLVHLASISLDSYHIVANFPFSKIEDLKGRKIGGGGPNMSWLDP